MADSKTLKLLLVEDDLEDEQVLCEALIEIDENRQWCNWRTCSIVQVEQLADALECLRQERFDAILLNLSLPDSPVLLDSFLEVNAAGHGAPVIVLADNGDENLANRLLREGAQDVLLKSELECAPLARSLRYAVERQRRANALPGSAFVDDLTGVLSRPAFLTIARHLAGFSWHSRTELLVGSLEISGIPEKTQNDREARELLLIQAGEELRSVFQPPALIGRAGRCCFNLITVGFTENTAEALLNGAALEIEAAAQGYGLGAATARFSIAEFDPGDSIDDQFDEGFGVRTRQRAKTVMLAV